MGQNTTIEWTEWSWNHLRGCSLVSDGCRNCYAMGVAGRFAGEGLAYERLAYKTAQGYKWTGQVMLLPEKLGEPLRKRKPRRIFVNSMSDLFHEEVPEWYIDQTFAVMALARWHTFQVLTKRAARMRDYTRQFDWKRVLRNCINEDGLSLIPGYTTEQLRLALEKAPFPLPNVWLGVSVENQAAADERVSLLLDTVSAVRWLSMEPLLSAVNLGPWIGVSLQNGMRWVKTGENLGIDWVVIGGESGAKARPMLPQWPRDLRDQCEAANVAFFFKQWGTWHTLGYSVSTGQSVFRQFTNYEHWVNKARSWVQGGICLDINGNQLRTGADVAKARDDNVFPITIMHRTGKARAGRLLDGVLHNNYPVLEKKEAA